jgi:hypothetical protein
MSDCWRRVAGATVVRVLVLAAALSAALAAALAGCSGHSPARAGDAAAGEPGWAGALGGGVVITAPAATAAGHGSPGAALQGEVDAIESGKLAGACAYFPPASQPACRAAFAGASASAGATVSVGHFALGYVAVRGTEALVGSTGKYCAAGQSPECTSNANPAALFVRRESFAALWKEAISQDSSGTTDAYSLAPCVRVSGRWYVYSPPSGP